MDNNLDYKWDGDELITAIKAKTTYLKSVDVSAPDFNKSYYEGMALAYHMIMDEIKSIAENFDIPLEEFGLDNYDPNEILDYVPEG